MSSLVAIEIAGEYLRAVEVKGIKSSKPQIIRYGELTLPLGAGDGAEIADAKVVTEAVKELWKGVGFKTKKVVVGVGGKKTALRQLDSPQKDLKQIRALLPLAVADILPTDIDSSTLDFYPVRQKVDEKSRTLTEGFVISSPSDTTAKILGAVEAAGLIVEFVDYNPFGLIRAFRQLHDYSGDCMILNVRETSTEVIAVRDAVPRLVRVLPSGIITRKRSGGRHRSNHDTRQAFSGSGATFSTDPVDLLVSGVRSSLAFYRTEGGELRKIFITGEGGRSDELLSKLADTFQVEVEVMAIESVFNFGKMKSERDETIEASILGVAGLAMRGEK